MKQRERIAMQRVLVREAIGKLEAVSELFGAEDEIDGIAQLRHQADSDFGSWIKGVSEFRRWIFDESPIA